MYNDYVILKESERIMTFKINPLKVQAAAFVVGYTAMVIAIVVAVRLFLETFGLDGLMTVLMTGLVATAFKMIYDVRLGQLEAKEQLKKMNEGNE